MLLHVDSSFILRKQLVSILLLFYATLFAMCQTSNKKIPEHDPSRTFSKTVICESGVWQAWEDGLIVSTDWEGRKREWNVTFDISDFAVGLDNTAYLLHNKGLDTFRVDTGPQSLEHRAQFERLGSYDDILTITDKGIWLYKPGSSIALLVGDKVKKEFNTVDLPRPYLTSISNAEHKAFLIYADNIGESTYLVVSYGKDSFAYLLYDETSESWKAEFKVGQDQLMPLVCRAGRIQALGQKEPLFSTLSIKERLPPISVNSLYVESAPGVFLTSNGAGPMHRVVGACPAWHGPS